MCLVDIDQDCFSIKVGQGFLEKIVDEPIFYGVSRILLVEVCPHYFV